MTRYGTLKRWAETLGLTDAVALLDATLQEETKTGTKLANKANTTAKAA